MNTTNKLLAFFSEENPLDKNFVCVFEQRRLGRVLLFQVDKRNFETDDEFRNSVDFIVNSLNKNL